MKVGVKLEGKGRAFAIRMRTPNCLMCGAKRPVSAVFVREGGIIYGVVCAKHTLRDVVFFNRGKGKKRLFLEVTRGWDR